MARKKPHGMSDGRLQKLWRLAVIAVWRSDPLSGERQPERLQCHHLIYRRYFLTRHDWRNGVPLSPESHIRVHGVQGNAPILDMLLPEHREYLTTLQRWTKKDYLFVTGLSEAEYLRQIRDDLEHAIEHGARLHDPDNYVLPDGVT